MCACVCVCTIKCILNNVKVMSHKLHMIHRMTQLNGDFINIYTNLNNPSLESY